MISRPSISFSFVATLCAMAVVSFASADDEKKEDKTNIYIVKMETSHGNIELELNREKAKETVDNFLEYARKGYYENTLFHRVEKGYVIQGGGYRKNSEGEYVKKDTGDRKPVKSQSGNGLKNEKGTIAAARWADGKDSAKSEFFINLADNKGLDDPLPAGSGFTVFGKVTKGMDIVEKIGNLAPQSNGVIRLAKKKDKETVYEDYKVSFLPKEDVVIKKVTATAKK